MSTATQRKVVVVPPGEGYAVWSVGDRMTFKIRSEHTDCDFVLFEADIMPGGGPPPLAPARGRDVLRPGGRGHVPPRRRDIHCRPRRSRVPAAREGAHVYE